MRKHSAENGFTLIELLVVVVLVAILAAIAIPMFSGSSAKAKANSEANAILMDIRTRMEQYATENGGYFKPTNSGAIWPDQPNAWTGFRFTPSYPMGELKCNYQIQSGPPGGTGSEHSFPDAGGVWAHVVGAAPGAYLQKPITQNWFIVIAACRTQPDKPTSFLYYTVSWSGGVHRRQCQATGCETGP